MAGASGVRQVADGASAAPGAVLREGRMTCGGHLFVAATQRAAGTGVVLSQRLALLRDGQALALPQEGRRVPGPAGTPPRLTAWASGWACAQPVSGQPVLYVLHTCAQGMRGCAAGAREWVRLYALDGRLLNADFPRTGLRTPALMRRLGLGALLDQGVPLSDVDEASP